MRKYFFILALFLASFSALPSLWSKDVRTYETLYKSDIDNLLTVQKVSVLPMIDNLGGIYARPLESYLTQLVDNDPHWDLLNIQLSGPLLSPEELQESPTSVQQLSSGTQADALLSSRITKGPNGISLGLYLFLIKDGKLLLQEEEKDIKSFEIKRLKDVIKTLYEKLYKQLPYQGIILSRRDRLVTINLGKRDGIEKGKIITVVQIIKAQRHPKFQFLISTEKEVLGKVKVAQVDDTLSFASIITEKEPGVIQKGAKLLGLDFVTYDGIDPSFSEPKSDLNARTDKLISFGKNATEWLPKKPPTFGQVGVFFGDSLFSMNRELTSDSLSNSSFFNLFLGVDAELWLTSEWTLHTQIQQGITSIKNDLSGSSPSDLSGSWGLYEFLAGYKFRMSPGVWGPQIEVLGGLLSYSLNIDDSSPRAYTSTKYSGVKIGVNGQYPIDYKQNYALGAKLFLVFQPRVSENPVSSGSGNSNAINQFTLFGQVKLAQNIKAQMNLDFSLYKTTWSSATTASSSSQKFTNLSAGIYWMF